MTKNALVVGGTSGLGLHIAQLLATKYEVTVTGRTNPSEAALNFERLDFTDENLPLTMTTIINRRLSAGGVNLLVWAVGSYKQTRIYDVLDKDIAAAAYAGIIAPAMLLGRLTQRQQLPGLIAISSVSQWYPNQDEPVYAASKSGLGALSKSLAMGGNVDKTLVVGPARIKDDDTSGRYLRSSLVAEEVMQQFVHEFRYREVEINRDPTRVRLREVF